MDSYCFTCKRNTKSKNQKGYFTKNKKYMIKSDCVVCNSKKSKFISEKQASGFFSNLFKNIPVLNKIF